jgi:hypothetical protein
VVREGARRQLLHSQVVLDAFAAYPVARAAAVGAVTIRFVEFFFAFHYITGDGWEAVIRLELF